MSHKLDVNTIMIEDVWTNTLRPPRVENETLIIGIDWSSNIGWGRYELAIQNNGAKIEAYSEHMDSNKDKKLLKALLEKIVDIADVVD